MTLHLTPVTSLGQWVGRWDITDDTGTRIGEVYVPAGAWPKCVAVTPGVEITGRTLTRAMTALAAVLEHATGYTVVDDPATVPGPPCSRVIPKAPQSSIRVDEATSTPIGGIRVASTGRPPTLAAAGATPRR